VSLVYGVGCGSGDCDSATEFCDNPSGSASTASTSGTGGAGASGGGGNGGVGGTPVGCVPSENETPVADDCGIFVSSSKGDDTAMGAGSKDTPFKTIQAAIEAAAGHPVYACAETFTEAVVAKGPAKIYGGLDCKTDWKYIGATTKTMLTAAADAIPLTLQAAANGSVVEDLHIEAVAAKAKGGSSIAVVVDTAEAAFTRCDLVAGDGAQGEDGSDASAAPPPAAPSGAQGNAECSADTVAGGLGGDNKCGGASTVSKGGDGGAGKALTGGTGDPGSPDNGAGQPGMADTGGMTWSCSLNDGDGKKGGDGAEGPFGAAGVELGTLTVSGLKGGDGGDGQPGLPGQGGGGGGGRAGAALASDICWLAALKGGASGGGGGAGGCGGLGGGGGKAGGSSIALISVNATLTLTDVTLHAGSGKNGGAGGDFQPGGGFGMGAAGGGPSAPGCSGGNGGQGGNGGPGGGGRGGHSIGLAYTGDAPAISEDVISVGGFGDGGKGGTNSIKGNDGQPGTAAKTQKF